MLDFSKFLTEYGYPLAWLLLAGIAGWAGLALKGWLNSHATFLDAQSREKIAGLETQALNIGAQAVFNWVKSQGGKIHPTVNSDVLRWGAQMAIDHAGGILTDNGASPEEIAAKVLAKLPPEMIATADSTGNIVSNRPVVESSPLGPIVPATIPATAKT